MRGLQRRLRRRRLGYNKACELEDFRDSELMSLMRETFAHDVNRFGADFPAGREYRKYWEVAMAARSLRDHGALGRNKELLGVGAGGENTIPWLTRHARRVHATDLYLDADEWADSAHVAMLRNPSFAGDWNPRRLVVQHMDGRDLRYEDATFDGVFSCGSIEHFGTLEDVRRALAEICRVLRPGGVAAISTELRLDGPAPGLPGVLMFDAGELNDLVAGLPWAFVDALTPGVSAATRANALPFVDAARDVRSHRERYGRLRYDMLTWSRYPHLVLKHDERVWTSVHLTLR